MNYLHNLEQLILGIQLFLAKNRSSLSVDQIALFEGTISKLKELQSVNDSLIRKNLFSDVLTKIMRGFGCAKFIKHMGEILKELINEN